MGRSETPGPTKYMYLDNPKFQKTPNSVIGKERRKTWIELMSKNESPGPANLYPSKHLVLKRGT